MFFVAIFVSRLGGDGALAGIAMLADRTQQLSRRMAGDPSRGKWLGKLGVETVLGHGGVDLF